MLTTLFGGTEARNESGRTLFPRILELFELTFLTLERLGIALRHRAARLQGCGRGASLPPLLVHELAFQSFVQKEN